jgi:quercetin dioxygenase-like cupin family protein
VCREAWFRVVVMAGELEWELTDGTVVRAKKDDIVWVPRGTVHHIRAAGDEMTLAGGGATATVSGRRG